MATLVSHVLETVVLRLVMQPVVLLVTQEPHYVVQMDDTSMDLLVKTAMLLVILVVVQVPLHV